MTTQPTPRKTVGDALLCALQYAGAKEIFGIPGDFALPLFKVFEESGILPVYTLSHEPGVGFAADAAARFCGRPSVAAVTYGAGAFNMINPVAAAYAEKSPVIVVSGGPGKADSNTGLGVHHQAKRLRSQLDIFSEVTCAQTILNDAETVADELARVLRQCRHESRPVYIEVPRDMVFEPCAAPDAAEIIRDEEVNQDALAGCVEEIIARVQGARSPVMVVGVETRRFGAEELASDIARKLGIPAATTFMGRGLLSDDHEAFAGTYMGVAGDPELTRKVESSDALLLLGVLLSDTNFGISQKQIDLDKTILACDGQVSLGYHTYPDIPLYALLEALNDSLTGETSAAPNALKEHYPRGLHADDEPITPGDIATAVNDLFAAHQAMPIAADMGDCLFTAFSIENTELVAPGYYATMGYGVPAGIGVQVACGRRPLIMVGDGAFQMTGWELMNCRRYDLNPIVVVFNNASWEMLRAFQPESGFNDLDEYDFAAIANALGGAGYRAATRRELNDALSKAVADESCFQLIDARIPRGALSPSLQKFTAGISRMRELHGGAGS